MQSVIEILKFKKIVMFWGLDLSLASGLCFTWRWR